MTDITCRKCGNSYPDHGSHYCYPLHSHYSDLLMCVHRGLARDYDGLQFPTCRMCPQFFHVLNLKDAKPIIEIYIKKNEISRKRALYAQEFNRVSPPKNQPEEEEEEAHHA